MSRIVVKACVWTMARLMRTRSRLRNWLQITELSYKLGKCGKNVRFRFPFDIRGAERMEVGDGVFINQGAFIRAQGGLRIGDNVIIARNVTIYTYNHNYMGEALPFDHALVEKPVVIEKNVWIGVNVTIVPGVRIGEGAIIGMGTVVSSDVPPLAIVGSAPPRIIKYRDREHYEILSKSQKTWACEAKKRSGRQRPDAKSRIQDLLLSQRTATDDRNG